MWNLFKDFINLKKRIIQWSDNCVAQNASWKILFFHLWLVEMGYFPRITLKMLQKGHTFNMCDLFFGLIERALANKQLLTQKEYEFYMALKHCLIKGMEQANFKNWKWLNKLYEKKR